MSLSPTACDRDSVKPLQFADSPAFILPLISQAHERVMPNANVNANAKLDFRQLLKSAFLTRRWPRCIKSEEWPGTEIIFSIWLVTHVSTSPRQVHVVLGNLSLLHIVLAWNVPEQYALVDPYSARLQSLPAIVGH